MNSTARIARAKIIEQSRRYARSSRCPHCHAETISGVDHEVTGVRVDCDPGQLDPVAELAAIYTGIPTYAAWRIIAPPIRASYELGRRSLATLDRPPHGGPHPILAEHRCGTSWPGPNLIPEINQSQELPDDPPF